LERIAFDERVRGAEKTMRMVLMLLMIAACVLDFRGRDSISLVEFVITAVVCVCVTFVMLIVAYVRELFILAETWEDPPIGSFNNASLETSAYGSPKFKGACLCLWTDSYNAAESDDDPSGES
jgi:hypothetical protein